MEHPEPSDSRYPSFLSPSEIQQLCDNGVTASTANAFHRFGIRDPHLMMWLTDHDVDEANFHSVATACDHAGVAAVKRVISTGQHVGRFPAGTLAAPDVTGVLDTLLDRNPSARSRLVDVLGEMYTERQQAIEELAQAVLTATDRELVTGITLSEDHFEMTGLIDPEFVKASLHIIT